MKRIPGVLLALVLVFSVSAALAQRAECAVGGFSVNLPDKFVEEACFGDPDLCFYWHGDMLHVRAYSEFITSEGGISDFIDVRPGYETDYGTVSINGTNMLYIRTEENGSICITYSWIAMVMDRAVCNTMEFSYDADDESSVQRSIKSIINSVSFDVGY